MFFFGTPLLFFLDFELLIDSCLMMDLLRSEGPSLSERIDDYLLKSLLELFFEAIPCFFAAEVLSDDSRLVRLAYRLNMVVWMEFCLDDILKGL